MRKITNTVFIIYVIIALILAFSSCNNPHIEPGKTQEELLLEMTELDRADEISRLSDEAMENINSYKATMTGLMETKQESFTMTNETKTQITYLNGNSDSFTYQEKHENTIKYLEDIKKSTRVEGYQDGYMYVYDNRNGDANYLKSALTKDEYVTHMSNMEEEESYVLDRTGCNEITAQRNDDGTWTVTYSNFTESNLKLLMSDLQNPEDFFDGSYVIADVYVSFTVESNFAIKEIAMEFIFEKVKNDNASQLSALSQNDDPSMPAFTMNYSFEYGENLQPAQEINLNLTKYKEISDLRILYVIENELDKIKYAKEASAELELNNNVTLRTQESKYFEFDKILFENIDGKLEYKVTTTDADGTYNVVFKDGEQTVYDENGNQTYKSEQSKLEARSFINSLLDTAGFGVELVKSVKKVSDGEYEITVKVDTSPYEDIALQYSGNISSNGGKINVKMLDGKITSYVYTANIYIYIPAISESMIITIESECTYEY